MSIYFKDEENTTVKPKGAPPCPNPNGCFCDGTCKKKPFKVTSLGTVKKLSEKDQKALSEAAKIYTEQNNTTLIEKLEGMKRDLKPRDIEGESYHDFEKRENRVEYYNQAIQDAMNLIKE